MGRRPFSQIACIIGADWTKETTRPVSKQYKAFVWGLERISKHEAPEYCSIGANHESRLQRGVSICLPRVVSTRQLGRLTRGEYRPFSPVGSAQMFNPARNAIHFFVRIRLVVPAVYQ